MGRSVSSFGTFPSPTPSLKEVVLDHNPSFSDFDGLRSRTTSLREGVGEGNVPNDETDRPIMIVPTWDHHERSMRSKK